MKTGMLAADAIFEKHEEMETKELKNYEKMVRESWVCDELKESRNFKGGFEKGLYAGLVHGGLVSHITKGKEPWTFAHTKSDSSATQPKSMHKPIEYPKHDGVLTFDLLTNLQRSGTSHDHDQPAHLKIKAGHEETPKLSWEMFGAPEERFCPAKVYEYVQEEGADTPRL